MGHGRQRRRPTTSTPAALLQSECSTCKNGIVLLFPQNSKPAQRPRGHSVIRVATGGSSGGRDQGRTCWPHCAHPPCRSACSTINCCCVQAALSGSPEQRRPACSCTWSCRRSVDLWGGPFTQLSQMYRHATALGKAPFQRNPQSAAQQRPAQCAGHAKHPRRRQRTVSLVARQVRHNC